MDTTHDNTLNNLFGIPVQYKVPIYQRRYVWEKLNWEALWRDILNQLDLELVEDPVSGSKRCEQSTENVRRVIYQDKHFTGVIVTDPIQNPESLEKYEVIDGQQRLTTFQIILCVIRDIFQSEGHVNQAIDANKLIVNTEADVERDPDVTYKFVITEYDKKEFVEVVNGEYGVLIPDAFDKDKDRLDSKELGVIRDAVFRDPRALSVNVLNAYNYFYEWIRVYMEKDFDFKKLDTLLETIKKQFTFVKIQLDSTDKSEKIFESINATGRKLSEFDYLRNNLFLRSRSLGENKKRKKSYRDIFYEDHWCFENDRSYWTPERLEDFLRTFLIAKLGPGCFQSKQEDKKKKKEFDVYQDQYIRNIKKLEDKDIIEKLEDKDIESELDRLDEDIKRKYIELKLEIRELERYSEDYKNATPDPEDKVVDYTEIGIHMQFYRDLKIQSFLPFVLHLKNEKKISDNELEQVFRILESRIIRRWFLYFSALDIEDKEINDYINDVFSDLIESPKFYINKFLRSLSVVGEQPWPDDKDILNDQSLRQIMNRLYANNEDTAKHDLQEIMQGIMNEMRDLSSLSTQHRAMLVLSYVFYRIEKHIDRDNKDKLHFGNFLSYEPKCILSDPNLSERNFIGNFAFLEKDKFFFNDSNLKLNKELYKELYEIEKKDNAPYPTSIRERTTTLIRERTEILYDYFFKIWPDRHSLLEEIQKGSKEPQRIENGVSNEF